MKMNCWLILGAMLSTSVLAQQMTDAPAAATGTRPAEKRAAAKSGKKKAAPEKAAAFVEKPVLLVPGPATVSASNVNVRGQATLGSEVITHLTKGDEVTVLEEITLEKHKADEPAQWARIVFPQKADAWVRASYIDHTNKVVLPNKLNLRAGPGENYSVVGVLGHGTPVREVLTDGEWMRIGAPTNAYAFIAAAYLKQEAASVAAAPVPAPAEPAPTPTPVAEPAPMAPAPAEAPGMEAPTNAAPAPVETAATPAPAETAATTPESAPAPAVTEVPAPPRIVQHEGIVKNTISIQAPTRFALVSADTGKIIDYLYTSSTNLDLDRYKGLHIIVTGEEGLDERWTNTPVITIQRIQVVE